VYRQKVSMFYHLFPENQVAMLLLYPG